MVWWPAGSPGVADRLPNGEWSPPLVTGTIGECCTSVSGPSVQSVQSALAPMLVPQCCRCQSLAQTAKDLIKTNLSVPNAQDLVWDSCASSGPGDELSSLSGAWCTRACLV